MFTPASHRPLSALLAFFLLIPFALLTACGENNNGPDDSGEGNGGDPTTLCPASFQYRPQTRANSVYVVGSWNDFDRTAHAMSGPDATGTWSAEPQIPAGEWGYFFLVDGAEVDDPDATSQITLDGKSYARVEVVCDGGSAASVKLSVQSGSLIIDRAAEGQGALTATLELVSLGSLEGVNVTGTLRATDGTTRELSASELSLSEDRSRVEVALNNLADGKYTVFVQAENGPYADDIALPFWIEAEPFSFYDSPIYMVMVDRFRNGDTSNDSPIAGSETPANFQGGDLNGVTQAIEEGYFDALGVRTLWLSPWQTQPNRAHADTISSELTVHVTGYHGYWPIKAREVEPRFGGEEALHQMVRAAHTRGMRVIMDTVLNHVHEDHEYVAAHPEWFRTSINCGDNGGWGWDHAPITCLFDSFLPDVDWTNAAAATQFLDDVEWWVETFDLDGLRLDAAKHMEDDVMGKLGTRMRQRFETAGTDFYMFGETITGDVGLLNKYIGNGQLDGQLDFKRHFDGANQAFLSDGSGLGQVNDATWGSINAFGDAMMVTLIGTHDMARVISRSDDANRDLSGNTWGPYLPQISTNQLAYDRVWMAMFHMMTTPGVPFIYYGDEYGEHGGNDPDNRHFMKTEAEMNDQQRAQLDRMKKLGEARETLRGLRRGAFDTMWVNDAAWGEGSGNLWAYVRKDPEGDPRQSAVMVLNLKDTDWSGDNGVELHSRDALKLTDLGWTSGTVYDLLTGNEWPLSNGAVTIDVPARGGVILSLR